MPAILTKPIVVPEYGNGLVKLYTPNPAISGAGSGTALVNPNYTVDVQKIFDQQLFVHQGRVAAPNACRLLGTDLFIAVSSGSSQAVLKLPNYLGDPGTAMAQAFVFTKEGSDYVGIVFDAANNLYTAEGSYGDNTIVLYTGVANPYPGSVAAPGNNYGTRTVIGNAGMTSYFGDLVFDYAGNLWAADYWNNRVVVFDAAGLGGANTYHTLQNPTDAGQQLLPLAVANTVGGTTGALLSEPEGLDFDGFGPGANLWVGNNNDDGRSVQTTYTSLVKITPALQALILQDKVTATSGAVVPNTNCFIYLTPDGPNGRPQFGGLQIDRTRARLYVNDEQNFNGRAYDLATLAAVDPTAASPADATLLGIVSTNPGNGGIAMLGLGAYVSDSQLGDSTGPDDDNGLEPTSDYAIWESYSFAVTADSPGAPMATLPMMVDVTGGTGCSVYVKVKNFDPVFPTTGLEQLHLYWGKASTGLSWPSPWDGMTFDTGAYASSPMGGTVQGSSTVMTANPMPIGVIAAGGFTIVGPFAWVAPDPTMYSVQDGHFCLLARVVTPGLLGEGLSTPETSDLGANAHNNARIAWRNIHITAFGGNIVRHRAGVIIANYTAKAVDARLAFAVLDGTGTPVPNPPGTVTIDAEGASRAALLHTSLGAVWTKSGPMALPSIAAGLTGLSLAAQHRVTCVVAYVPAIRRGITQAARPGEADPDDGYVLRVIQYNSSGGSEILAGGQSFVFGTVAGFPYVPAPPVPKPPGHGPGHGPGKPRKGFPQWLLWLLLGFLLSRCVG